MLEMLINLAYAAFLFRASSRVLFAVVALCGVFLVPTALHFQTLDIGVIWSNLFGGILRVGFSFTLGIVIARRLSQSSKQSWIGIPLAGILTTVLFADPSGRWRALFDMAVVVCIGPTIVWLGASYDPPPSLQPVSRFLGEISYPLYAVHYPMLLIVSYVAKKSNVPDFVWMPLLVIATVFTAYGIGKFFDLPARQWLARAIRSRQQRVSGNPIGN